MLSAADREQVWQALRLVQADTLADRDFSCISDGQRQRVLLARAVCQQPEILLLDEPTSFLDVKGKAELLTILRTLAREKQVAVIVTLHELAPCAQAGGRGGLCIPQRSVTKCFHPRLLFAEDNIRTLFDLTAEQYAALYGKDDAKPKFEHYIRSGQKAAAMRLHHRHLCGAGCGVRQGCC